MPAALVGAALLLLSACAGTSSERNLAPLFNQFSPAGGGVETEALGGALLTRRTRPGGRVDYWAFRPIVSHRRISATESFNWFLPPFGYRKINERGRTTQMLPIFRFASRTEEEGRSSWSLISLPGIYWAKRPDGRVVRAWFPFGGVAENFLSFDRIEFWLFPLWVKTERYGRKTWHFPFPFLSISRGAGGNSGHVWPLFGRNRWKGRYDRWFFLWPIFQVQHNNLNRPPLQRRHSWMIFPLFGASHRGTTHAYTFLWPFFGYAYDSRSTFWAWDGPWPLVRLLEPATPDGPRRRRFWPIYSFYEGDGLKSQYFLWPIFNRREETYPDGKKHSSYVLPFFQSSDRTYTDGDERSFRKFWPLVRREWSNDSDFLAFPALNPLWRIDFIDEHYAWLWELYTAEREGQNFSERTWLGLWHRERDQDEDRRALSVLWSRRDYTSQGTPVRETSYLFGLLRFRRRGGHGLEWLAPAFPGPGWPLERVPRSFLPAPQDPR